MHFLHYPVAIVVTFDPKSMPNIIKKPKTHTEYLYYGHRTFVLQLVTTFIANVNGDVFVDGTLEINNIQFNTTQISCLWFDGSVTQLLCWYWSVLILCTNFFSHIALCGNLSQTTQYLFIQMLGMEIPFFFSLCLHLMSEHIWA